MRILVLGFPLPNPQIDNYTFISAPCLFDYDAVVIDPAAASQAVEEVIDQRAEHTTWAREPVVNGFGDPVAVGLADILRRRQEETVRYLSNGGLIVCFAYPDILHPRVSGFTGYHRYWWLPAPPGLSYREPHLVRGSGRHIIVTDYSHPFSLYGHEGHTGLAYRAYFTEDVPGFGSFAKVFMRSAGGAAVGVELRVLNGRVIFLPPPRELGVGSDRIPLASALVECVRRALAREAEQGAPAWVDQYSLPGLAELSRARDEAQQRLAHAEEEMKEAERCREEVARYQRLLWQEGKPGLEAVVRDALRLLGFAVTEDLDTPGILEADGVTLFLETEGSSEAVDMSPHYRLRRRREEELQKAGRMVQGLLVVNGFRGEPPEGRPPQFIDALRLAAESMRYCLLTADGLFRMVQEALAGASEERLKALRQLIISAEGELRVQEIFGGEEYP